MKKIIQNILSRFGYRLQSKYDAIMDQDPVFKEIYEKCKPYTMTTKERMFALYESVKYVVQAGIPGDFVECGVWKGGSVMVMLLTLANLKAERKIWLYDTFGGMSEPTKEDVHTEDPNISAMDGRYDPSIGTMSEVQHNLASVAVVGSEYTLIPGKVEVTLRTSELSPKQISILRLDTDWYASTKAELEILYPRVSGGGVLIIDDYGAWAGAKKAVDEYFKGNILLTRIDHDSRLSIK